MCVIGTKWWTVKEVTGEQHWSLTLYCLPISRFRDFVPVVTEDHRPIIGGKSESGVVCDGRSERMRNDSVFSESRK